MSLREFHVRIRRLSVEDADLLKAIRVEAAQESPASVYPTPLEEAERSIEEFKRKLVWDADNFVFGAFDHEQLAGIAGLKREAGLKIGHTALIWGVYVKSPFRGRGLAHQLVATVLEVARDIPEVIQIKLRVHTKNEAAKRLYRASGFESYGIDKSVLRIGDTFFDEELMVIALDNSNAQRVRAGE
jgi:RimJ/RimL family protein N-acetyltransferase